MENVILRTASPEDFEAYYSHKSEESDIYWNGFSGKPNYEGIKGAFLGRIGELSKVENGKCIKAIDVDGKYAGYIQFTLNDSECEIGIGVSEKYAGKGIGRKAVLLAVSEERLSDIPVIFARIRDDNLQSQKCFLSAGFEKTDMAEEEYYAAYDVRTLLRRYLWKKA